MTEFVTKEDCLSCREACHEKTILLAKLVASELQVTFAQLDAKLAKAVSPVATNNKLMWIILAALVTQIILQIFK